MADDSIAPFPTNFNQGVQSPPLTENDRLKIRHREYQRRYYLKHRERILARSSANSKKNRKHKTKVQMKLRHKNKVRYREMLRRTRQAARTKPKKRMRWLTTTIKRRARLKGLVVDGACMEPFVTSPATKCACCEVELDYTIEPSMKAPSVDRIDNTKGYVFGNVAVVCRRCNIIKSAGTIEDHERIVAYMRRNLQCLAGRRRFRLDGGAAAFAVKGPDVSGRP